MVSASKWDPYRHGRSVCTSDNNYPLKSCQSYILSDPLGNERRGRANAQEARRHREGGSPMAQRGAPWRRGDGTGCDGGIGGCSCPA